MKEETKKAEEKIEMFGNYDATRNHFISFIIFNRSISPYFTDTHTHISLLLF